MKNVHPGNGLLAPRCLGGRFSNIEKKVNMSPANIVEHSRRIQSVIFGVLPTPKVDCVFFQSTAFFLKLINCAVSRTPQLLPLYESPSPNDPPHQEFLKVRDWIHFFQQSLRLRRFPSLERCLR